MKLTPESLAPQLAQRLLPVYLISGDEPLLAAEAADAVRAAARTAGFAERTVHFIERAGDWDGVRAASANLSLFAERRLSEIRLASPRPGAAGGATLRALIEARDPDTLYLILAPRLDREAQGADWVRAVEAHGAWLPVWPIDGEKLVPWLRARSRRLGLNLADEALEILAARVEGNLLAAHQELEKLALLEGGAAVGSGTVLASVADSARFDVFALSDAVLEGDTARALRILAVLRAEGTEPTLVLWALAKAVRDVWNARSAGGRPPAWQRQALERALRRASRLSFRHLLWRAARADRIIKGRIAGNAWDELALLAAEMCGEGGVARLTLVS